MSINIPVEIRNLNATLRQQLVAAYLYEQGVEIRGELSRDKQSVVFKAIGSESFSGHVYQNGVVYIFSEHKEPLESNITTFEGVMRKAYGSTWRSICAQMEQLEPIGKPTVQKVKRIIKAQLADEPAPPPDNVYIVGSYVAEKGTKPAKMPWLKLIEWIRNPPVSWKRAKARRSFKELKMYDTPAIVHVPEEGETIGWLDIDGKTNDKDVMEEQINRMRLDNRVFCVFKSLSGNGYAVGVGVRYSDKEAYQSIMKKVCADFSRDFGGIQIDPTCQRWSQKRGLSWDESVTINQTAIYYEEIEMQEIDNDTITEKLKEMTETIKNEVPIATTMMDLLDKIYDKLDIHITENAWNGNRVYSMKGQTYRDDTPLYLAMLSELKSTEANAYNLHKTEICDFMRTKIDVIDVVREKVLGGRWDGVNRWPQFRQALHLDHWDLRFFQLWFRQGVALLHNNGNAHDIQRNFMLILHSRQQHIGKTELVKKISCGTGSFTQKSLNTANKDSMMEIYSNWIYEYGELGSQFRKSDINTLKSFITDSAVTYRRPYDREATQYPVRTSIIGTTNEDDLFIDPTGNRRYLIISCKWSRDDWDAINEIDFIQLWRQARAEWQEGDEYVLTIEDQKYNESRCHNKRVITTEMYAIIDVMIKADKSGVKGIYRIDERSNEIVVSLLGLLKHVNQQWKDVKMYNLIRELEGLGFKRDRSAIGDFFRIEADSFKKLLDSRQALVP